MSPTFSRQLRRAFLFWWREQARQRGAGRAASLLVRELSGFVRDSTPERRRQRYGDMDYDWEHHVNTTSGTVGWRERLVGVFRTAYQPTDPAAFREMMAALSIQFRAFTFVDIGSGKGRTLLLASEYPFARIIGVEILPELHRVAQENIRAYSNSAQPSATIESLSMDAGEFTFPPTPLVVYLFNPLSEAGLVRVIRNLEESLLKFPREVWVVYHNPLLEGTLAASKMMERVGGAEQFSLYRSKI